MADEYRRFWLASSAALERERLLAEAFEAGAAGAEEFEAEGRYRACVYAASGKVESILSALRAVASSDSVIGESELVPAVDWIEAWKQGLEALRISSRLVLRPPFIEVELEPGQRQVVIEPAQAFGSGGHASTRLCLEWIDGLYARASDRGRYGRVLDVGTGNGVLALAALVLGAESALGFDLDPIAIRAARSSARDNGLVDRVGFFVGPIEALGEVALA
ncbi:MAG: 50S ribosomal protein L11 methyltransferase, partial [Myxococcota bacterium]